MQKLRTCLLTLSGCLVITAYAEVHTPVKPLNEPAPVKPLNEPARVKPLNEPARVKPLNEPARVKPPKSVIVTPSPYTAITIAQVRHKAFPYSYTLSYRFVPTNDYLRAKSCSRYADKDENIKRLFGCPTTEVDTKVIPVLSCSNRYNKTSRPTYMGKDDLLLGLSKALEWAGINKSAKLKFNKGLPPSGKLTFAGMESGLSLVFAAGCPIAIAQIQKFSDAIRSNYAATYRKSVNTNVDELFK